MSYTIIGQNNGITTLEDENGHILRVPSRAVIASDTTFTLTSVNNNMATLEDSNGKVYRDIPCVAVLYGEGGGGGGSVDYSKTVQKSDTIPAASSSNAGQVYLYTGAINANFTQNYIYKNVKSATYTGTVSFEPATLSGSTIACSGDDFATFVAEWGTGDVTTITNGTLTYDQSGGLLVFVGQDDTDTQVCTFQLYTQDYEDAGFTITGTLQDGDVFAFTCTVEEASATYTWTRIDVQPTPSGLPDQTGQSGKFLTTDGTDASWSDKPLVNTNPGTTTSLLIGNSGGSVSYIGQNAISIMPMNNYSGWIALGTNAISIGNKNSSGSNSINIGGTSCDGNYAIQLGYNGTNSDANTFKVANANGNFEIMSADGTIPAARHASLPASDGTYVLKLVISSGVPTLSWVAE